MSKEKTVSKTPCNHCKDATYRVYINATKLKPNSITYSTQFETIKLALLEVAGFTEIQAKLVAESAMMMVTPQSLLFSGEKDTAINVSDRLLKAGIEVTISNSKDDIK